MRFRPLAVLSVAVLSTLGCADSSGDESSESGSGLEGGSEEAGSAEGGSADAGSAEGGSADAGSAEDGSAGDGDASAGDGDASAGDGDGDADASAGDGDGDGDGDASAGDGDGDGDASAGDGDGDASAGDGDAGDGDGDGGPGGDDDSDGVPNGADPLPNDPQAPATANVVYAHSSSTLYTMTVDTFEVTLVGAFGWPVDGGGHQMTDVAVDRFGVLYGVTFDRLYSCDAESADCVNLGVLPASFNGLTMVPAGVIDPDFDTLVGISTNGDWYQLEHSGGVVTSSLIGSYGGGYTSSGDAFSIEGVGTYASVNSTGVTNDVLVNVDPATGAVTNEIAELSASATYGLAGWPGIVFAFDAGGTVEAVDPFTGVANVVNTDPISWWGAGVRTVAQ